MGTLPSLYNSLSMGFVKQKKISFIGFNQHFIKRLKKPESSGKLFKGNYKWKKSRKIIN